LAAFPGSWTVTLAVSQRVRALLEKAGAKVIMTRTDDRDVYPQPGASDRDELQARVNVANSRKADLFLSIHANAFNNRNIGGTTVYYYQKTQYDLLLAQTLSASLVPAIGLADRGVKPANFYVVRRTLMPAALIELAYISNPTEEKLLMSPQFQEKSAQAIVAGLDKFFAAASLKKGGGR